MRARGYGRTRNLAENVINGSLKRILLNQSRWRSLKNQGDARNAIEGDRRMKSCLYCTKEKEDEEFSEEHILPQAIGGNLTPTNPFKSGDICQSCNNLCGLFVDAPFIKNWFTQADRTHDAFRYVKFDQDSVFPLRYMGPAPELQHESKMCEFWIGPTGDSIYHFHEPYAEVTDMPILVGPAPNIKSEIDPGFVFIYIVASNPDWWVPIIRSLVAQFPSAQFFLGNGPCPEPESSPFSQIPSQLNELHQKLNSIREDEHGISFALTIGYETRFLAKLALGFGHLFLDGSFSTSSDAQLLRDMMWERDSDARESIPVRGAGILSGQLKGLEQTLSWETGHIIGLLPSGNDLCLYTRFYNRQTSLIKITGDRNQWKDSIPENGMIFCVTPGLRKCVGPIPLIEFVGHKQGLNPIEDLVQLEHEALAVSPLPPVHVDQPES